MLALHSARRGRLGLWCGRVVVIAAAARQEGQANGKCYGKNLNCLHIFLFLKEVTIVCLILFNHDLAAVQEVDARRGEPVDATALQVVELITIHSRRCGVDAGGLTVDEVGAGTGRLGHGEPGAVGFNQERCTLLCAPEPAKAGGQRGVAGAVGQLVVETVAAGGTVGRGGGVVAAVEEVGSDGGTVGRCGGGQGVGGGFLLGGLDEDGGGLHLRRNNAKECGYSPLR